MYIYIRAYHVCKRCLCFMYMMYKHIQGSKAICTVGNGRSTFPYLTPPQIFKNFETFYCSCFILWRIILNASLHHNSRRKLRSHIPSLVVSILKRHIFALKSAYLDKSKNQQRFRPPPKFKSGRFILERSSLVYSIISPFRAQLSQIHLCQIATS